MELGEINKVRATYDEAVELLEHLTLSEMYATREMYATAYMSTGSDDRIWNEASGLLGVYALGFLSGARAIREKNASKENRKGGVMFCDTYCLLAAVKIAHIYCLN